MNLDPSRGSRRLDATSGSIMGGIPLCKLDIGNLSKLIALSAVLKTNEFLSKLVALPLGKKEGPEPVVSTADKETTVCQPVRHQGIDEGLLTLQYQRRHM